MRRVRDGGDNFSSLCVADCGGDATRYRGPRTEAASKERSRGEGERENAAVAGRGQSGTLLVMQQLQLWALGDRRRRVLPLLIAIYSPDRFPRHRDRRSGPPPPPRLAPRRHQRCERDLFCFLSLLYVADAKFCAGLEPTCRIPDAARTGRGLFATGPNWYPSRMWVAVPPSRGVAALVTGRHEHATHEHLLAPLRLRPCLIDSTTLVPSR